MATEQDPSSGASKKCPVYFCGTVKASVGFDTFFTNVEKISSLAAQRILALGQVTEKTKDVDYGIIILLIATKNDLVAALNALVAAKKRIDRGALRIVAYNLLDNEKIAGILKSKGCAETFTEGLTQKALVHKLQKHVQIANNKHRAQKADETTKLKAGGKKGAGDLGNQENANKVKFVPPLQDPNDCWLLKNKRDFKYIRGNWMGEMIGPGPSVGSWVEAGGTTKQPIFRWTPRQKKENDPFVPGGGSWFFAGRKPEFEWKTNRWRFVGETPSLFYRAPDAPQGAGAVFRFRSTAPGSLEVSLNSGSAKSKLKAIIETFADEKVIKEDKKKKVDEKELTLEKEKKKKKGEDYGGELKAEEEKGDWNELEEGDDGTRQWNDRSDEGDEEKADWNDKSDEGEEEEEHDWSGLDVGRGNKFNSGRGLGQGDGDGGKGYKYDEDDSFNDRTGEGEEEEQHDWTGLDVGRGNKFTSGRGLGQGQGGGKGYKYDKDDPEGRKGATEDEELGEDSDDLFEDENLDPDQPGASAEADAADGMDELAEEGGANLEMDPELDDILGEPSEDPEWETGASAFEKITLDITVSRPDAPGAPSLGDVSLIERQGMDLLLDAPTSAFTIGERVGFAVELGNKGQKKKLLLNGSIKKMDPSGENRDIVLVGVTEISRPQLGEIQAVFDARQAQLLKFLREAKG